MWCFNWTCFLSNLPIVNGERVILIPIMETPDSKDHLMGSSYCDQVFEISWPAIRGVYNDYGWIEDIEENEITNLFEKAIKKNLNKIKLNRFWEKSELENIEEDYFLESFINENLLIGCFFKNRIFWFIMIQEDIFNETVGLFKLSYNFDSKIESYKNSYFKFKTILTDLKKEGTKIKNSLSFHKVKIPVGNNMDSYNPIFQSMNQDVLANNLGFFKELQSFYYFCTSTRKIITPMCWNGSQMEVTDCYLELQNAINKRIKKLKKRFD